MLHHYLCLVLSLHFKETIYNQYQLICHRVSSIKLILNYYLMNFFDMKKPYLSYHIMFCQYTTYLLKKAVIQLLFNNICLQWILIHKYAIIVIGFIVFTNGKKEK